MSTRRFVALPERLLIDAIKVAESMGVPYTVLIERILSEVLKVLRHKRDLLQSLAMVDSYDDIRRLGGVVLPEKIVRELLTLAGPAKLGEACSEVGRMAAWFAELAKVKRSVTPAEIRSSLELWLPSARVDVIREGDNDYKFVVSFVNYSRELLEVSKCVVEGLARGYGLDPYDISMGSSVIVLRAGGLREE